MQTGKLIAVATAVAINAIAVAAFLAWSAHTSATAAPSIQTQAITTLPVVNVYPSAAEWRVLDTHSRAHG